MLPSVSFNGLVTVGSGSGLKVSRCVWTILSNVLLVLYILLKLRSVRSGGVYPVRGQIVRSSARCLSVS